MCSNLALVRADVSRLPFSSGSVDAVHAGAALHCWPSPSNAVGLVSPWIPLIFICNFPFRFAKLIVVGNWWPSIWSTFSLTYLFMHYFSCLVMLWPENWVWEDLHPEYVSHFDDHYSQNVISMKYDVNSWSYSSSLGCMTYWSSWLDIVYSRTYGLL